MINTEIPTNSDSSHTDSNSNSSKVVSQSWKKAVEEEMAKSMNTKSESSDTQSQKKKPVSDKYGPDQSLPTNEIELADTEQGTSKVPSHMVMRSQMTETMVSNYGTLYSSNDKSRNLSVSIAANRSSAQPVKDNNITRLTSAGDQASHEAFKKSLGEAYQEYNVAVKKGKGGLEISVRYVFPSKESERKLIEALFDTAKKLNLKITRLVVNGETISIKNAIDAQRVVQSSEGLLNTII